MSGIEPITVHTKGAAKWGYWESFCAGIKLILGAKLRYSICVAIQPRLDLDNELLGLDHAGTHGIIVIDMGGAETVDAEAVDPITHIKVINNTKG